MKKQFFLLFACVFIISNINAQNQNDTFNVSVGAFIHSFHQEDSVNAKLGWGTEISVSRPIENILNAGFGLGFYDSGHTDSTGTKITFVPVFLKADLLWTPKKDNSPYLGFRIGFATPNTRNHIGGLYFGSSLGARFKIKGRLNAFLCFSYLFVETGFQQGKEIYKNTNSGLAIQAGLIF